MTHGRSGEDTDPQLGLRVQRLRGSLTLRVQSRKYMHRMYKSTLSSSGVHTTLSNIISLFP